jgi:hypothetical protein
MYCGEKMKERELTHGETVKAKPFAGTPGSGSGQDGIIFLPHADD